MPLIDREIIKLIEDVSVGCGTLNENERRFTTKFDETKSSLTKLYSDRAAGPGSRVRIFWKMDNDVELIDDGYIFTLPGYDSDDIYMAGIVHIPEPVGGEKSKCDPEWFYLFRLIENPFVQKIEIR